jgi:hypothetical protein
MLRSLNLLLATSEAFGEIANVEDVGSTQPDSLECVEMTRSRVIRRICYDEYKQYMVVDFDG